jgi:hypothetical protein
MGKKARAVTVNPNKLREDMLQDMPIEEFERMMETAQSRSDEMWDRSRQLMDPDSEINQRMEENVMGRQQDMLATQQRFAMANQARSGMMGSGIAAQQQDALGLASQQQGLMSVQQMLQSQNAQGFQAAGMSSQLSGQALGAGTGLAGMIGGANQASVNAQLQNAASRQSAQNTNAAMWNNMIGSAMSAISDRRLKKDIKKIGYNKQGYSVYEFKYKSNVIFPEGVEPNQTFTGVMADEVSPKFVNRDSNGWYSVDYSKIDGVIYYG